MVIGYDEGTIMIKMGREVPVASMDASGKIIWAKHNEIQTVNIKTVGANFEVSLPVLYTKLIKLRSLADRLLCLIPGYRWGKIALSCEGIRQL